MKAKNENVAYGGSIVATLSQQLSHRLLAGCMRAILRGQGMTISGSDSIVGQ